MGSRCSKREAVTGSEVQEATPAQIKGIVVRNPAPLSRAADREDCEAPEPLMLDGVACLTKTKIQHGSILSKYDVLEGSIGSGRSGPVKVAVVHYTGQKVCVKSFPKINCKKEALAMLRNEAQIHLRLEHPNIAKLHEVWEDAAHVHMVTEFCSGGELYDRIASRICLQESEARVLSQQILSGLLYLHNHSIVHRDLKPENIVFQTKSPDSVLKLLDFGYAKVWDARRSRPMEATCGSLCFVSPEVLKGSYTNAVDIWSFGVILYYMLVGYPPFYGTEDEVMARVLAGNYSLNGPRWSTVSDRAKDLIRCCLELRPDNRLSALDALNHSWLTRAYAVREISDGEVVARDMIQRLWNFGRAPLLQRAALLCLAYDIPPLQSQPLGLYYVGFDLDGSSCITKASFATFVERYFGLVPVDSVFANLDSLKEGKISWVDFLASQLGSDRLPITQTNVSLAFQKLTNRQKQLALSDLRLLTTHGDGSRFEMTKVLKEAGLGNVDSLDFVAFEALVRPPKLVGVLPVNDYVPAPSLQSLL
ncbi:MAG: hypothetical protein KVP17_000043 [Porospora cf. gigantea B]|uniref:uncharacterized protein n=1 Tax=Porospora cf. gigantea B TaxID=2853592 RepID=UPI0035717FF3|nr:MAG: hypothetical protein KVP17_000043 [Porospora cf. gigantea B]